MKNNGILWIFVVILCVIMLTAGCTSPKPATTSPAATAAPGTAAATPAALTTPACPDKLVWDGAWDSAELDMAGNHDLSNAFTRYSDRIYGDKAVVKMTQTCWNVEGTLSMPGKCEATFKGTVDKNVLSGTWSGSKLCSKSEDNRKFSLTMAADNKSWLGDLYDAAFDPAKFPSNWAGRRTP